MSNIEQYLENLLKEDTLEKASQRATATLNQKSYEDNSELFWKPTVDKAGNGIATIRFLPGCILDGDDAVDWIPTWSHGFKGPTGIWYIEECPTTIKGQCPVCDSNRELWNTGIEANKKLASARKRKLQYISNIYIISDPANPDMEGQVKLFKYGATIFDFINSALHPQFPDEPRFDPFNLLTGANFIMKMRVVEEQRKYDKSKFDVQSPFLDGNKDQILSVIKQEQSLLQFVAEDKFKPFEDLKKRLDMALGIREVEQPRDQSPKATEPEYQKPITQSASAIDDLDGADMDFFKNLTG